MTRAVAVLVLICFLAGCSSWRLHRITPQQLLSARHPKQIRVMSGNAFIILRDPHISGDSLRGFDPQALAPRAVALNEVRSLESWQADGGKTTLLVVGIAGGFAVLWLVAIRTVLYDDS